MEEKFWDEIREEFPITKNMAYFHSAGMSPIPNRVLKAITQSYENINMYGDMYFQHDLNLSDLLREKFAERINTQAQNICYAHNTSTAFSFIAAALKHSTPFDFNLVSLIDEFPATNVPFEFQGIPIKYVEPVDGAYTVESIISAIDEKTMGVVCSHVQYATGFKLDIERLGKALVDMDLLFIVNATQSFPIYEIDVEKMNIDVLCATFHKWGLSGIQGALFFTSEGFRNMYPSPMAGWLGVHPPANDFIPTQKNEAFEQFAHAGQYNFGTMNFHALAGLDTAMDFMKEIGWEKIRTRISSLTDYLIEGLMALPLDIVSPLNKEKYRSPILLIHLHNEQNAKAVEYLREHNVITSVRADKIRISCNFFNNFEEIYKLLSVLSKFCEIEKS